jgi:MFS family permease
MPSPPATAVTDQPDAPATSFPRLVAAMFSSTFGAFIALLTPLQLLLTLKVVSIAGHDAASALGTITGVGALLALVANPVAGRISDRTAARFGRRRTWILTGALAGSLVVFALAFTTQVWQVAVTWCAAQAIFNLQLAATSALLADQVPVARRGTVSGITGVAATVGALVGIAAVSGISRPVAQWGVVAGVSAALGVLAVILLRDPRHPRAAGQAGSLSPAELVKSFWLNPWKHPAFGWAWLVRFLITCAYASATYNALFVMHRFGVSASKVAGVVLVMSLLNVGLLVAMSVIAGPVSDRLRRQKPFAIAAGVVAAGALVLMATASTLGEAYVAAAVLGLGSGLLYAIDTAMCVRMLPSVENAGKDLGIINLANTLPQSLVPFIAPFLLSLGGFPALYVTLAVFGIAGTLAVLRLPEIGREGDQRWAAITRTSPRTDTATISAAVN